MKIYKSLLREVVVIITWCVIVWASCLLIAAVLFFKAESDKPIDERRESIDWNISEGDRSSGWTEVRNNFVKKHPACAACGSTVVLNVHHIKPFHLFPKLELDETNLITLCRDHHFRVGHDPDGPWAPKKPNWSAWNPLVKEHSALIAKGRKIKNGY